MNTLLDNATATGGSIPTPPYFQSAGDPASGLIILCDHASNFIPEGFDGLGLPSSELDRHIAYDPGAAMVTSALAEGLGAPAVMSNFSRLVIDPNRGEDDPTLIMRLSDGAVIPGNLRVDAGERHRRIERFHSPYHEAITATIDNSIKAGTIPALVSIHSFSPVWRGHARRWHVGILWDRDPRLAEPLISALSANSSLTVGDNEPYSGALANDTLYRHGTRRGLAHALIEIRQDLIADEKGAFSWAERLRQLLCELSKTKELHEFKHYGSRTGPFDPY